jgi:hypothetical protein
MLLWLAVGAFLVITGIVVVVLLSRMRRADFTTPPVYGEKPPWLATDPPPETVAATQADGEDGALWDYDPGELVAAPFSEQIEDIVRSRIAADPQVYGMGFDLGTAEDGSIEFWVDGQRYASIDDLPSERLRQIVREAIKYWDSRNQGV